MVEKPRPCYNHPIMATASTKQKQVPDRLLTALHRIGVSEDALREAYDLSRADLARALAQPPEPLRVEDMEFVPDDAYQYELWEGELVRMCATKRRHTDSAGMLAKHLGAFLLPHPLGEICIAEGGFRAGPGETLYCPDIGYVSHERRAAAPLDEFYPFAPDIAIEVWSPDNTEREMEKKTAHYLTHGSRQVWLLRPQDRTVRVHCVDGPVQTLRGDDLLTSDDVLPGFSVPVSELFPD
jgi:Uma2 family endonuclease